MPKALKLTLKIICIVLAAVIVIVGGYVAYVFIAYHRLGDMTVTPGGKGTDFAVKDSYTVSSYNIGFGAYESDYGFFMDGGKQSWAWSKERLDGNMKKIAAFLKEQDSDFYFLQEVDYDSTRTYHVDEREYLTNALGGYSYAFAPNYDSPFLFYPLTQPHGASKSGIMTFSTYHIQKANRVELPVESGLTKLLDLDRCYSKSYVRTENETDLVLYNFHLSAYTSDGKIANEQLKLLLKDMQKEYEAGNYCLAAGDFNKDLLGDSSRYFGKGDKDYTWAQPIPDDMFDGFDISLTAPLDESDPVPSCRNADSGYHKGQFVVTLDGFLTTDNIQVISSAVIDTQFAYSDHNPVTMEFSLADPAGNTKTETVGIAEINFTPYPAGLSVTADDMNAVKNILEERLKSRDITGFTIEVKEDASLITVRIPCTDIQTDAEIHELASKIGKRGVLTFCRNAEPSDVIMDGSVITKADPAVAASGDYSVNLTFNAEGKDKFAQATGEMIGRQISIFLDGDLIASPTVQTAITEGKAAITLPTAEEAIELAATINTGPLPFSLTFSDADIRFIKGESA